MYFESRDKVVNFQSHWTLMKSYKKELGMQVMVHAMTNGERGLSMRKHNYRLMTVWLVMTEHFVKKFGIEQIPLELRKEVAEVRSEVRMEPLAWPDTPKIDWRDCLHTSTVTNELGAWI